MIYEFSGIKGKKKKRNMEYLSSFTNVFKNTFIYFTLQFANLHSSFSLGYHAQLVRCL